MIDCYCEHIPPSYKTTKCRKRSRKNYCYDFGCGDPKPTRNWPEIFSNLRKIWSFHCKADLPLCGYNYWEDQSVKTKKCKCISSPREKKALPVKKKHLHIVQSNNAVNNSDLNSSNDLKSNSTELSYATKSILKKGQTSTQTRNVVIHETPYYENEKTFSEKYEEKEVFSFNFENNTESQYCSPSINSDNPEDYYFCHPLSSKNKVKFSPSTENAANCESECFDRKMRLYYDLPDECYYQNEFYDDDKSEFVKNESSSYENIESDIDFQCCSNCNMCLDDLEENTARNSRKIDYTENDYSKYKIRSSSGSDSVSTESYGKSRCCKRRKCPYNHENDSPNKSTIFDIYNSEYSKQKMKPSSSTEVYNKSKCCNRKKCPYNLQNFNSDEATIFDIDSPEYFKPPFNDKIKSPLSIEMYDESKCCNRKKCPYNLQNFDSDKSTIFEIDNLEHLKHKKNPFSNTESYGRSRCCNRKKCPYNLQNLSSDKSTVFEIDNRDLTYLKHKIKSSSSTEYFHESNLQNYCSKQSIIFDIDIPKHKVKATSSMENNVESQLYNGTECPYCGQEYKDKKYDKSRQKYSRNKYNTALGLESNKDLKCCIRKECARKINKNINQKSSKQPVSSSSRNGTENKILSSTYSREKKSNKNYKTSEEPSSRTEMYISSNDDTSSSSKINSTKSSKTSLKSNSSSSISRRSTKKPNSSSLLRKTPAKPILPSKSFLKEKKKQAKLRNKKNAKTLAKRNNVTFVKNEYQKLVEKYKKDPDDSYHQNICLKQLIDGVPSTMFPEVPDIQLQFKPPGRKAIYVLKMKNLFGNCYEKEIEKEI